ncbi:hypothetical protein Hanom_Chr16g01454911 [Helianthus anomalus]
MLFVHCYFATTCLLCIHISQLYLLLSFSLSQYNTTDTQRFTQNHTSESPIQRPNFSDQHTATSIVIGS